jgi:Holliday junction resolvasome RuvABC DNA-binding subunit
MPFPVMTFFTLTSVSGIEPPPGTGNLVSIAAGATAHRNQHQQLDCVDRRQWRRKKSAERLVVELRDKPGPAPVGSQEAAARAASAPWQEQVRTALLGLGWNPRDAQTAIDQVATMQFEGRHDALSPAAAKCAARSVTQFGPLVNDVLQPSGR